MTIVISFHFPKLMHGHLYILTCMITYFFALKALGLGHCSLHVAEGGLNKGLTVRKRTLVGKKGKDCALCIHDMLCIDEISY